MPRRVRLPPRLGERTNKSGPKGPLLHLFLRGLLSILVHVLGHCQMVLQRRQGSTRPVFELWVLATLGVTLEKRNRVLVSTDLHRIIFSREVFGLAITKFAKLLL